MDTRKIIQALTYFAYTQKNHQIDNIKAYKLLWIADRYQLRRSGKLLSGDTYYAMPKGPVPSDAKKILENQHDILLSHNAEYSNSFIHTEGNSFVAIQEPDMTVFSVSDREVLAKVMTEFNNMSSQDLSDLSHKFPEWTNYKAEIEDGKKRSYLIDVDLFFQSGDCTDTTFFDTDEEIIALSKELYHLHHRI